MVSKSYSEGVYTVKGRVPTLRSYVFGSIEVVLGLTIILSNWGFGLLLISIGVYTFISGLLFTVLHKEETDNMKKIQKERIDF